MKTTSHFRRSESLVLALVLSLPIGAGCAVAQAQPVGVAAHASGVISNPRSDGKFDYDDGLTFDASITTPAEVLGYEIGEQFTRHADMVRYLELLAQQSDRIHMQQYGESHQQFPLYLLTISSPTNLARLDEILYNNRQLTQRDLDDARLREILDTTPAIAWLSYNVHGNEPSPTETAMQLAYTLAAVTDQRFVDMLDDVIVVIDPMLNPDGHNRYVSWYRNTMGVQPNANPDAAEHFEPWPGGRSNHYLFDLNRDWLWLVHPESRSRLIVYRQYMPHLHIDYHEQGYMNPYFLGGGDDPYNVNIPAESREWIERYGDANAEVFDARGLLYSSKERFDYLYPGYGKVLPVYHGAVGMLAEKAGHSRAGLAIEVNDDYTLTLTERAYHHWLLSMSNIETTAAHRRGQLERFRRFFAQACDPTTHTDQAYIINADNDPAKLAKLWDLCTSHGIEIYELTESVTVEQLYCYQFGIPIEASIETGSWVIPATQPLGRLVTTLFERETEVTDTDTYDITSWNVPVAFGLRGGYVRNDISMSKDRITAWAEPIRSITGDGQVALIVESHQHRFPQAIGRAVEHGLHARVAGEDFRVDGRAFSMGSLIVHRIRNSPEALAAFEDDLRAINLSGHWASRGMTEDGPVLGANANRRLTLPKIALLRGSPTSSLSYGHIWHVLDIESPLPYSAINIDDFGRVDLDRYNVIIIPDARGNVLNTSHTQRLNEWVRGGGTVIALGSSATWACRTLLELRLEADDDEEDDTDEQPLSEFTYEERRQRSVDNRIPGATLRATIDTTHPLAAGISPNDWLGIIKRGSRVLPVRDNGFIIARFTEDSHLAGSMSERNVQRLSGSPLMTQHRHGRGSVICLVEDPTLRGFQHHAMRLLLNAAMYGPTY
jgi:hypothetical protein